MQLQTCCAPHWGCVGTFAGQRRCKKKTQVCTVKMIPMLILAAAAATMPAYAQQPPAAPPAATTGPADCDFLASNLIDTNIYNGANENTGEIEDVVISPDGKVSAVIVSVGGFLGVGDRYVSLSYTSLKIAREGNNDDPKITAEATKDALSRMPEYTYRKS